MPVGLASPKSKARVAERQTRSVQVAVFERVWEFKSPLAHQIPSRKWGDFSYVAEQRDITVRLRRWLAASREIPLHTLGGVAHLDTCGSQRIANKVAHRVVLVFTSKLANVEGHIYQR